MKMDDRMTWKMKFKEQIIIYWNLIIIMQHQWNVKARIKSFKTFIFSMRDMIEILSDFWDGIFIFPCDKIFSYKFRLYPLSCNRIIIYHRKAIVTLLTILFLLNDVITQPQYGRLQILLITKPPQKYWISSRIPYLPRTF